MKPVPTYTAIFSAMVPVYAYVEIEADDRKSAAEMAESLKPDATCFSLDTDNINDKDIELVGPPDTLW